MIGHQRICNHLRIPLVPANTSCPRLRQPFAERRQAAIHRRTGTPECLRPARMLVLAITGGIARENFIDSLSGQDDLDALLSRRAREQIPAEISGIEFPFGHPCDGANEIGEP